MTYQQLFEGRILLSGALRHIAQEHGSLHGGSIAFRQSEGADAFLIVSRLLGQLELEFRTKREKKRKAIV